METEEHSNGANRLQFGVVGGDVIAVVDVGRTRFSVGRDSGAGFVVKGFGERDRLRPYRLGGQHQRALQ